MSHVLPLVGSVYSFRTSPASEFSPPATGRSGAFKVLGLDENTIVVALLDTVWNRPPSMADALASGILVQHRFELGNELAIYGVSVEWWPDSNVRHLVPLGETIVSPAEELLARQCLRHEPGSVYTPLDGACHAAEAEWRWTNDRDAYVAEVEQVAERNTALRAEQEERRRNRLNGLTWEQLLRETLFERWSPSPPFPPEAFIREARQVIHGTCRSLRALGSKPRKRDVRKLLRECVEWFNVADEQTGYVIETEEREDICAALAEMAFVTRHPSLVEEVENWRNW